MRENRRSHLPCWCASWVSAQTCSTDVERKAGPVSPKLYAALTRLEEAGIIQEITGRKRDRVWAASDLMVELEDLDSRIASAMKQR